MTNEKLFMTIKEINIITVMKKLKNKELGIKEASVLINKSERQTKRLKKQYILHGENGIIHKLRGKPSNHKIDDNKYVEAIAIIKDKYYDYGPTLCAEKLAENHNIFLNISTLRNQMINNGIWKNKSRKKDSKQFTARERKENFGEMIQYDGSYHMWFEGRNGTDYQCLLVSIDDATGEVVAKFALNEGLFETMLFWKEYIEIFGKPLSIYLDKFATYKVNYANATDDRNLTTQFGRICNLLGIKLIFANSPQAKGRVERMNQTLQDRLVKELRENNISDIDLANKFLKDVFLPKFNRKFKVIPRGNYDLHSKLSDFEISKIYQIFSEQKERIIANDYTISFENKYYQLYRNKDNSILFRPGNRVIVEKHLNGDVLISKNGEYIDFKASFERQKREFKLYTAPIPDNDLNSQKDYNYSDKKINTNLNNTQTYYQKHKKVHPFVANCFN